jgi:hypothetical protein
MLDLLPALSARVDPLSLNPKEFALFTARHSLCSRRPCRLLSYADLFLAFKVLCSRLHPTLALCIWAIPLGLFTARWRGSISITTLHSRARLQQVFSRRLTLLIVFVAAAQSVSFSSYGGMLSSLDDFYIMSSGLVAAQDILKS